MRETDLVPGDIIFFENNYKDKNMQHSHDYIDHVAMYDGLNDQNIPMIIHSITSERGYYYPEKASGLCKTSLRALTGLIQKESGHPDVHYDVTYKVFRFKDKSIANRALDVIRKQAQFRIPYDEKRLNEKLAREDSLDENGFKELGKSLYRETGIYRSLKYAARSSSVLTRTRGNGIGRGLTCSMSVILAFQIAELLIDNKVSEFSTGTWASDKYAPISVNINKHYPAAYINYIKTLRLNSDGRRTERDLKLSYDFWMDKRCPPEAYTHTSFAVDAKTIGAAGLFAYMLENDAAWEFKDILVAETRHFTVEEKAENKRKAQSDFRQALEALRTQSRISPASSPEVLPKLNDQCEETELDDQDIIWIDQLLKFP